MSYSLSLSEELDRIQQELENALNNGIVDDTRKSQVKVIRSRRETRFVFIFKGSLEDTEDRFQRIYKSLIRI